MKKLFPMFLFVSFLGLVVPEIPVNAARQTDQAPEYGPAKQLLPKLEALAKCTGCRGR